LYTKLPEIKVILTCDFHDLGKIYKQGEIVELDYDLVYRNIFLVDIREMLNKQMDITLVRDIIQSYFERR